MPPAPSGIGVGDAIMTLSASYRAVCASGDPNAVIVDTVELYHPDWPSIIRLVADRTDLTATPEATAPNNPGASVLFTAFPMQVDMPRTGDGPQDGSVTISSATRLVMDILEAADLSDAIPIRVIMDVVITGIVPRGRQVEITAVPYDARIHAAGA